MHLDIFVVPYTPTRPRRHLGHFANYESLQEESPLYLASATRAFIEKDIRAGSLAGALWDPACKELIEWELT